MEGELKNNCFEWKIDIFSNGSVVVGPLYNSEEGVKLGHIGVFAWACGTFHWIRRGQDLDGEAISDWFGSSVAMLADGSVLDIGTAKNDDNGENFGHFCVLVWDAGTSQ